jgi:hypothetical protein
MRNQRRTNIEKWGISLSAYPRTKVFHIRGVIDIWELNAKYFMESAWRKKGNYSFMNMTLSNSLKCSSPVTTFPFFDLATHKTMESAKSTI